MICDNYNEQIKNPVLKQNLFQILSQIVYTKYLNQPTELSNLILSIADVQIETRKLFKSSVLTSNKT